MTIKVMSCFCFFLFLYRFISLFNLRDCGTLHYVPAMSDGVEKSSKRGMFARNVAKLTLDNVKIEGQVGEAYELEGVDELIRR